MKKYGLGIALLVLAGLVLFQDYLPSIELPLWKLALVVGWSYLLLKAIIRRQLVTSFVWGTLVFIILNNHFDWVDIDTWTVILGSILACAGVKLLIKPRRSKNMVDTKSFVTGVIGDKGRDTAFGSSTRYIHDDNFLHDSVEVVFGSSKVYFDQAIILGNKAEFHIDAAFSSVDLYLPANWQAVVELDSSMSAVNNYATGMGEKMLHITGDMAFSTLNIYYT
ncbi:hypothetical protein P7J30_00515 [Streptococcus suis]|uniref:hypothetical protein n=1 Tax=Streptococcus suis TaxID=1307 RepID=UPI002A7B687D|nr:hypothetical protein [Streptococcus suis]HEM5201765.1 hypothetical protein [Streptococcus suis]HEM5220408.1 hypothetical protein [Streptococcus suis]HEM5222712.1 hypothetical protein [Streptococcus suis]HEM5255601.1 hypothetical protein [Streptococcus suis]